MIVVDVHAEATSEKVALARWLDGRVTAVLGTHTHVQTSDARVQPGGTAAITDVGMTGPHDSVIGVKAEQAIHRMRTGCPSASRRPRAASGSRARSSSATPHGRATAIEPVRVPYALSNTTSSATSTRSRASTSSDGRSVELARQVPVAGREPELRDDERARRGAPRL